MHVTLVLALALGLSAAAPARSEVPAPEIGMAPPQAMAAAMDEVRQGAWTSAAEEGALAGPIGRAIVEWHRLRAGEGSFPAALAFLKRYPDWPGLPYLRRQNEEFLPWFGSSEDVIAFFDGSDPQTGDGTVALVRALAALDRDGEAQAQAVLAWRSMALSAQSEAALLEAYPDLLRGQEIARLDAALWEGWEPVALRSLARIEEAGLEGAADWRALARARMALREGSANPDPAIRAVPARLQTDPGLAYERFRWRLRKGLDEDAVLLLLERSVSPETLGRPEAWAGAREDIARERMRAGDYDTAYAVAASHWLTEGSDFAALEWLAGYVALRFRDDAQSAVRHFRRFRGAVATPISLGRAGYWLGRAHEALGNTDEAQSAYAAGAQYQTSFYGLLAAERGGLSMDPALVGRESYPPLPQSGFFGSDVLEAGLLLQAAGERDLAERFLVHLAESLDETDLGTLADLALSLGEPHVALLIAKEAANKGVTLPRPYYPVVDLGLDEMPVPRELALAIARRESEFDPGVASGVGATGLMQVMPGTARDVARELNLPFSRTRLFADPSYNARLGTAYLAGLVRRFGDNPVLVAAGYNAGPGRPLRWMEERGDPRGSGVDVIDWIEAIPFDETRNYVMRVAESLPVYRARIAGEVVPLRLREELSGR